MGTVKVHKKLKDYPLFCQLTAEGDFIIFMLAAKIF